MCKVCNGRPNCPVCGPVVERETCPECNGQGYLYYNGDGVELTEEAWKNDPLRITRELCGECLGEGEVIKEPEEMYC